MASLPPADPQWLVTVDERITHVDALWRGLRAEGMRLTPEQLEGAYRVAAFSTEQRLAHKRFVRMLAGVFAKNRSDLDLLSRVERDLGREMDVLSAETVAPEEAPSPQAQAPARLRRSPQEAIAAVELGLAVVGAVVPFALIPSAPPPPPPDIPGKPVEVNAGTLGYRQATLTQALLIPQAAPPWAMLIGPALAALPFLLALLAALVVRAWRRPGPRLSPEAYEARLEAPREPAAPDLFQGAGPRAVMRSLRRAPPDDAGPLDVEASVLASAKNAGRFTPVYGAPPNARSVHVLLERLSLHDHLADTLAILVRRLEDSGVAVQPFSFRQDPRTVRDSEGRPVELDQLPAQGANPAILVLGMGDGLLHPVNPRDDAERQRPFERWAHRVILTTRRLADWGRPEQRLTDAGWSVAPVSPAALRAVAGELDSTAPQGRFLGVRIQQQAPPP